MKKLLLLTVLMCTFLLYSQNGAHSTTSRVSRLFVSKDESKFLTFSGTEIVLWDNITNQMIWMKKLSDLGLGSEILYDPNIGVDPYLKYMVISNKMTYRKIVNLNTFTTNLWSYYTYQFTDDGRIAVMDYDHSKKNSHRAYLLNLDNGEKELIADKMGDLRVSDNKKLVKIMFHGKSVNDYNHDKSKIFDCTNKSFSKDDYIWKSQINNFKSLDYTVEYSFGEKSIRTRDASGKEIAYFKAKNPVVGSIESNKIHLFYVSETKPHAYFLEQDSNKPNEKLSFVYVYDITNGNVIKKIELHDTSETAQLIAQSETKRQNQIDDEKQRIYNSPESLLNRRLQAIQGYRNYAYNSKTKGVYFIVPDKPLYEGNLVRMDALNDNPKFTQEVYEKLENLENTTLYTIFKMKPKTCSHCNGKGYFSNSYQRTVADYEYTTGKKLVETTTHTNSCGNCGGCGLTPTF